MLQEPRRTWEQDEWSGFIDKVYRTYTCTKGLWKSSYQRTFSLLLNIKCLLGIALSIPGILSNRGHFHTMAKVGKYESIRGGLVELDQAENVDTLDLSEEVVPPLSFFFQSRDTIYHIMTGYDGERKASFCDSVGFKRSFADPSLAG